MRLPAFPLCLAHCLALTLLSFGAPVITALAEDALTTPAAPEAATPPAAKSRRPAKGRRVREKEAEGTQAPNRFEADTVLKSRYQLDGKPLEVDPD